MEKKKRHYPLDRIKQLVNEGSWTITSTALKNAWQDFGWLKKDIQETLMGLENDVFYKSMTSYQDSAYWQDVYRRMCGKVVAYIKISIVDDQTVVIQFKRKWLWNKRNGLIALPVVLKEECI